jgi:hypothetical protein
VSRLCGKLLTAGIRAKLNVVKRILRCAATNVDPHTGIRDLNVPHTLQLSYGHGDCGVYAEVVTGGVCCGGRRNRSPLICVSRCLGRQGEEKRTSMVCSIYAVQLLFVQRNGAKVQCGGRAICVGLHWSDRVKWN